MYFFSMAQLYKEAQKTFFIISSLVLQGVKALIPRDEKRHKAQY